jgi:hypothetical protein
LDLVLGYWGGTIPTSVTTTLNGALNNCYNYYSVFATSLFPTAGRLDIGTELITYTGKTPTTFTGCVRGANGSTAASHLDNAIVTNATSWVDWGEESNTAGVTLAPGSWSLDNYGQVLVATLKNGATYTWDPSAIGITN